MHKIHPELKPMGGEIKKRKNILVKAIYHVLAEINGWEGSDLSAKLIASMPRRLAAVRLAKGKQTKY